MAEAVSTLMTAVLFVSVIWLAFGFVVWLFLGVATAVFARRQPREPSASPDSGWKPSLLSVRGLALAALYTSILLVPLGVTAIYGWDAVGDDQFGVFSLMTIFADLLTILLVFVYVRILLLLRRGASAPSRLLWIAFATTILGQAVVFSILLATGLPHAPGLI